MKELIAVQKLLDARVEGCIVTAYYGIRLINNTEECISNLSIKQQIDKGIEICKATVRTEYQAVRPIAIGTFLYIIMVNY